MNTQQNLSKGKLVVIDGGDGSGKGTQAKLLIEYLQQQSIQTKLVDFPQYYDSFYGKTVAKFLRGEFGDINQVSPYLASLTYALDRASVKDEMNDFMNSGGFIIANRYATSNMAHQGAKFTNEKEREEFLAWEYELEYEVNKIPKENLVIYLYVPWQISQELVKKKDDRPYLQGAKEDIHEKDQNHKIDTENMYKELAKRYPHWVMIDCTNNGAMRTIEEIHGEIVKVLKEKNIL
jgi:dTMP kinase